MKLLELFAGSRSVWKEADKLWYETMKDFLKLSISQQCYVAYFKKAGYYRILLNKFALAELNMIIMLLCVEMGVWKKIFL